MDTTILLRCSRLVELAYAEITALGNHGVGAREYDARPDAVAELDREIRRIRPTARDLCDQDRPCTLAADATAFARPDPVQRQDPLEELAYVL